MSIQEESDIGNLLDQLETHPSLGLTEGEARKRLRKHGRNELTRSSLRYLQAKSAALFCTAMCVVFAFNAAYRLLVCAVALGLICLLIEATLKRRAERDREETGATRASVLRNGQLLDLPAAQLVPGDIVRVRAGDIVPADGRLTEAVGLVVEELGSASDSAPIEKDALCAYDPLASPEDRRSRVFMGANVVRGRGTFVVTETGSRTRVGRMRPRSRNDRRRL